MIKKYNNISLAWGIPGIAIQLLSLAVENQGFFAILLLLGTAMLITGLAYYAKGIGRSPAWCLMGFLSIVGLLVLFILPDLKKDALPDS